MGKHEREKVYRAEKIVDKLLNKQQIGGDDRSHELFDCASALTDRIENDFPNIRESEHIGNIYGSSIGDIKLLLKSGEEVFLELKFLDRGVGTLANISQDTLTKFRLFKGENVLSWSDFRKIKKHEQRVLEELNKYGNYPGWIQNIGGKGAIYKKAAYLKDVIGVSGENTMTIVEEVLNNRISSSDEKLAAEIIKKIMDRDRKEKLEYISYLKTLEQGYDNIKKFLFFMIVGAHTETSLKEQWNVDLSIILNTLRHKYYVYYIYKKMLEIRKEDYSSKLEYLLDKQIFISFKANQTNVLLSYYDDNGTEVPVLRIVFLWKNKFQGIETPCLNIFTE